MYLFNSNYRLELHWQDLTYKEGECHFKNAYFSGPVLSLAEKIQANDKINLDFFRQYYIVVENVYIGELSWGDICYKDDQVYLMDCKMTHKSELNKAPKLSKHDYMIIDCGNHDRSVHSWNPNYRTFIVNLDKQVYNYEK